MKNKKFRFRVTNSRFKTKKFRYELRMKTYKNLFEIIKRKSQKSYYSEKILSFKGDAQNTWKTMKDLIGKAKMNKPSLPQKIRAS